MSSLFKKLFEYLCISLAQPEKQRGIGAQVVERRCHAKVIGGFWSSVVGMAMKFNIPSSLSLA